MENDRRASNKRYYTKNCQKLNARNLAIKRQNWDAYLSINKEQSRRLYAELRKKAIAALGGCCVRCEYSADIRALQIDHIAGGGKKDRLKFSSQWSFHKHIIENGGQDRYQCLCANCNAIKRMELMEHPPGRKRKPAVNQPKKSAMCPVLAHD